MIAVYLLAIAAGCFLIVKGCDMVERPKSTKKLVIGLLVSAIGIMLISFSVGAGCDRCTEPSHSDDYFDTWTGKPKNPFPFGYPVY